MTASISASIPSLVAAVAVPVAPAAPRWRVAITRAVVPIARTRAAVISAAAVDDHARLNDRPSIAITGFVAWRGGFVACGVARVGGSGVAAASRVSGRAVRVDGAAGDQGGRSEDQACNCEFHHEREDIP
jgi:hypothetical protein